MILAAPSRLNRNHWWTDRMRLLNTREVILLYGLNVAYSIVCVHKSAELGRWSHNENLYLILFWLCPTRIWHSRQCLLLLTFIKAQRHSTTHISKHKTYAFQRSQTIICLCGGSSHLTRSARPSLSHIFPIQNIAQYGNCKVNFSCIIPTLQRRIIISSIAAGVLYYTKSIAGINSVV